HERPVGARVALLLLGADELQRVWILAEAALDLGFREAERRVAVGLGAGALLGQRVADAARRAVAGDRDTPFLDAIGDGTFEARIANFPQRWRKRAPDQALVRRVPRLAPHELVPRALQAVVDRELRHRRAPPFGAKLDAAALQHGVGLRLGELARL